MADFLKAYNKTAKNEGGYANDPDDRGGETWKGIARKMWPLWKGWAIIDYYKGKPDFLKNLFNDKELESLVQDFYRLNFWNALMGDKINSQAMAESIYDSAVNMGVPTAIKLAQRTVGITESGSISHFLIDKLNNNDKVS
jgi:lysozyme family protein